MIEKDLELGDFILMPFGSKNLDFYVSGVLGSHIKLTRRDWRSSGGCWFLMDEVKNKSWFICAGKKRWWWRLFPLRDLVCPFKMVLEKERFI